MMYHPELILALVRSRRYYRYSGDSSSEWFWICLAVIGGILLLSFLYGVKFKPVMWLLKIPVYILCFLLIMPYLIAAWVMIICGEILKGLSAFDERILESIPNLFEEKGKKIVKAEPPKPIEPKIDGRISRMEQEIYDLIGRLNQAEDENKVLEKKCREYENKENLLSRTMPGLLVKIYLDVIEKLKASDRWEGIKLDLFDKESETCKNAYEHLLFLYREGVPEYPAWEWIKGKLTDMLLHEYSKLNSKQRNFLYDWVRDLHLIKIKQIFPYAVPSETDKCIRGDEWEIFLLKGFEEFLSHSSGVEFKKEVRIIFNDWDE